MLSIIAENERGKQISLTYNEENFQIDKVTGLNPPNASIASFENIDDGDHFTHSRIEKRNIVISLFIRGDVEENRLELYRVFQNKKTVKLYFETYRSNVWIEGAVETVEVDQFNNPTTCEISVICHDPFFKSLEEFVNSLKTVESYFYFPCYTVEPKPISTYSIVQVLNLINDGNAHSGMTVEIYAYGEVVNPIIYNRETREYIGIGTEKNPFTMTYGDKVVITTGKNNSKIKLIRNAVETNIFNRLIKGSKFLTLSEGDNVFTYSADSGNEYIDIKFRHYAHYTGI